ncbi:hypothetical protein [Actinoplanes sp. NBRC 103695]|uniref:carbohydrate ABC transporter permease n=1 Tax=Actinoplanes sp. NBRC 103695 TaxID=3032202 RepID=UPI00249FB960|nr:hypothetical protein Acsp02_56630 [Actinoplanes sp. NBRC 103695]
MRGKRLFIATFLIPPLLLYGVFVVSPYAQAFQISTTNWGGLAPDFDFVGLANFDRLLGDGTFWNALKHNAILLLLLPVVTILLGLFLASMISVGGRADRAGVHGVRGAGFIGSSISSRRCCRWPSSACCGRRCSPRTAA